MQTFFLFALIIASVGLMVIAISKWKIHPFIVMTVIALLVGLIWGTVYPESELTPAKVVSSVKSGFGDIMTSIGIVILCGTIIGTILEKTGAALTMANAILKLVGKKNSVVAMGAMGSDAAIEAADVVLMDDDPLKISKAIRISRKCLRIVYENIVFALGIKGLCLVLGAMGIANMWAAIFADVGVMVIAVLNAIRALQVKNL